MNKRNIIITIIFILIFSGGLVFKNVFVPKEQHSFNTSAGCPECWEEEQQKLLAPLPEADKTYVDRIQVDSELTRKYEEELNRWISTYARFNYKYVIAYTGEDETEVVAINKTNGKVLYITKLASNESREYEFDSNEINIYASPLVCGDECPPSKIVRKYQVLPNDTVVKIK